MPNRLAREKSLYLQQHAENPVDWYPWGQEALARAAAEDKPLLVSIGYSACHWCHVMAHESFEDAYIAGLMNTHFVCVKVDREERPDVDRIYMEAVQMLNGHGGWPLNMFCLPDGRPFAGGTYFPPDESRSGMIPWPQLLMRVADFYKRRKEELVENAQAILGNLEAMNLPIEAGRETVENAAFLPAAQAILETADPEFGGFGNAPKFPPSSTLEFLLALRATAAVELRQPRLGQALDGIIPHTLTNMARGGLFDQIGGGFARYSVDAQWHIPHFEKMLYDNGLLLDIYARAWRRYREPLYAVVVEETIGWLTREMAAPGGGFYSALDADSEGVEGKYYVWTPAEVLEVLGPDEGERFCAAYDITAEGNFEHGTSHARLIQPEQRAALAGARQKLMARRAQRVAPGRDPKQVISWNALVVRGLAEAAFSFGRRDWLELADQTAHWIWETMRRDGDRLPALGYDGQPHGNGFLDDYAATAEAFLAVAALADWLEPGRAADYLDRVRRLRQVVEAHFGDPEAMGFFFTSDDHEQLVHRSKEWFDTATPAGNSALAHVYAALEVIDGDATAAAELERLKAAYPGLLARAPQAVGHALSAYVQHATGLAVVKAKDVPLEPLRAALAERPWRRVFLLASTDPAQPSGYQLCVGTECLAPTTDPTAVAERV